VLIATTAARVLSGTRLIIGALARAASFARAVQEGCRPGVSWRRDGRRKSRGAVGGQAGRCAGAGAAGLLADILFGLEWCRPISRQPRLTVRYRSHRD
jgi:hypothetical protein